MFSCVQYKPKQQQITIDLVAFPAAPVRSPRFDPFNRLSQDWSEYFMAIALLAAQRSVDPNTQVGACITKDGINIVGIGYNGFPSGCDDDQFPWNRNESDPLKSKYFFVCHAEVNAISNTNAANMKGSTLYVTLYPCAECAKVIIQSGIKRVVFLSDKYASTTSTLAAKLMFHLAHVSCDPYSTLNKHVAVDFTEIN